MRPVVRETLMAIWVKQGHPDAGQIFLNKLGKPYADTRQVSGEPVDIGAPDSVPQGGDHRLPHPRLAAPQSLRVRGCNTGPQ